MKKKINYLIIASDGWPLEEIIGHPIINFFRRFIHGRYKVCRDCWYAQQTKKEPSSNTQAYSQKEPSSNTQAYSQKEPSSNTQAYSHDPETQKA